MNVLIGTAIVLVFVACVVLMVVEVWERCCEMQRDDELDELWMDEAA